MIGRGLIPKIYKCTIPQPATDQQNGLATKQTQEAAWRPNLTNNYSAEEIWQRY
jgi:hypothetical protein